MAFVGAKWQNLNFHIEVIKMTLRIVKQSENQKCPAGGLSLAGSTTLQAGVFISRRCVHEQHRNPTGRQAYALG